MSCPDIFKIQKCDMGPETALAAKKWKPRTEVHVPPTPPVLREAPKSHTGGAQTRFREHRLIPKVTGDILVSLHCIAYTP